MSEDANRARELAIEALQANPLAMFSDEHRARLREPGFDVSEEIVDGPFLHDGPG